MFVVHHWETVPRDYIASFDTLEEAIEFRGANDFDENGEFADELVVSEYHG